MKVKWLSPARLNTLIQIINFLLPYTNSNWTMSVGFDDGLEPPWLGWVIAGSVTGLFLMLSDGVLACSSMFSFSMAHPSLGLNTSLHRGGTTCWKEKMGGLIAIPVKQYDTLPIALVYTCKPLGRIFIDASSDAVQLHGWSLIEEEAKPKGGLMSCAVPGGILDALLEEALGITPIHDPDPPLASLISWVRS